MHTNLESLVSMPHTPLALFALAASMVTPICTAAIFIAILINFLEAKSAGRISREKKSFVETGSMTLFFVGYYCLIHFHVSDMTFPSVFTRIALISAGIVLMLVGCIINLLGRRHLGANWANQVTIYADQTLVTRGVYGIVRHPLYFSLILMFFGASYIYQNGAAFLANALIFIPGMYYRARQEELLLGQQIPEYRAYQQRVGMLFPKLPGGQRHESL